MNISFCKRLAFLLAFVMLFSCAVACSGIGGRTDITVSSDHFTVDSKEMGLYLYQVTADGLIDEYYFYQYGLLQTPDGFDTQYPTVDTYVFSMLEARRNLSSTLSAALAEAKQDILFCEGALALGMVLEEAERSAVDDAMKTLEDKAQALGLTADDFISRYMGKGITQKHVRAAMEKSALADKFAAYKKAELSETITDEEMRMYVEENRELFYKSDYHAYQLVNEALMDDAEACRTLDDLKLLLVNYALETNFDACYHDAIENADIEDPNGKDATASMVRETVLSELGFLTSEGEEYTALISASDTEPYRKAAYEIVTRVKRNAATEINKIMENGSMAYVDLSDEKTAMNASDAQRWIFEEGRKVGDIAVIASFQTDDTDGLVTTTKTYTWYCVTAVMALDEKNWEANARETMASERIQAWLDETAVIYPVTEDYDASEWEEVTGITDSEGNVNGSFVIHGTANGMVAIMPAPSITVTPVDAVHHELLFYPDISDSAETGGSE